MTGKQMQRMKCYYDSSAKPQQFEEGEEVLVYDPRKERSFRKMASALERSNTCIVMLERHKLRVAKNTKK